MIALNEGYTLLKELGTLRKYHRVCATHGGDLPAHFFPSIVHTARSRLATDDRDRIYGLLGLDVSPTQLYRKGITVDYTESTRDGLENLCCEYGKIAILAVLGLFLLQLVASEERDESDDFPSWCPLLKAKVSATALSSGYKAGILPLQHRCVGERGHPSYIGLTSANVEVIPSTTQLRLQGAFLDTIVEIGPGFPLQHESAFTDATFADDELLAPGLRKLLDWLKLAEQFVQSAQGHYAMAAATAITASPTNARVLQHLRTTQRANMTDPWRILVGDLDLGYQHPASQTTKFAITTMQKTMAAQLKVESLPRLSRLPWKRRKQLKIQYQLGDEHKYSMLAIGHLSKLWSGRKMIRTKMGWMGLSSTRVQVGDVVVLIYTGVTPLILRPFQTSTGQQGYRFVSDAFVHGMMDGQIFDLLDQGLVREQWFTIH